MLKLLHISSLNSYLTTNSKNTRPKYKKKELSSLWDDQERIRVSKQRSPSSSGANLSCAFSTETFFVEFSTHTAWTAEEEEEEEDPLEDKSAVTLFLIICEQK